MTDYPLTNGMLPEWASEWGHDEFGPWCSFEIEGIRQVLRWILPGSFRWGALPKRSRIPGACETCFRELANSAGMGLENTRTNPSPIRLEMVSVSVRGLTVFLDTEHVTLGDSVNSAIRQALPNATCVVPCFSNGQFGEWQRFEIESYIRSLPDDEGHRFFENIVPVLLPDAPQPEDSTSDWNTKRWLDFRKGLGEVELEQLMRIVQATINARPLS